MIQGEPLEKTNKDAKSAESVTVGRVMQVPERAKAPALDDDALSVAMGLTQKSDSVDTDVQDLVHALADVERDRDDEWIETAQTDTPTTMGPLADKDDNEQDTLESALADLEVIEANDLLTAEKDAPSIPFSVSPITDEALTEEKPNAEQEPVDEPDFAMPFSTSSMALSDGDDGKEDEPASHDESVASEKAVETEETVNPIKSVEAEDMAPTKIADEKPETPQEIDTAASPDTSEPEAPEANISKTEAEQNTSPNVLGLQAIGVLHDKISDTEERYDDALTKIGHALGVIAERIDGLEGRFTSQTIANVAMATAPAAASAPSFASLPSSHEPQLSTPTQIDDSVAPYIAQAERELEARKESGPMDIFDRIAKAAETEYDGHSGATETKIVQNASDGRRVGTKRWQPSKTVKRRMEQLEKAKNGEITGDPSIDVMPEEPRSLRADVEEITSGVNAPRSAKTDTASVKAKPMLDLDEEIEEDDDAGLSVVPGARGRRRNRARKSRLDEDFENVFEETEGKPSIQSLRRKMRERPAEEPVEEDESSKGGLLGGILGKKSTAKSTAPAIEAEVEDDEDALMAAFGAPEEDAPKPSKKSKKSKAKAQPKADADDDDEDWGDEETSSGINFAGGPLLYVLIACAAAAAFFVGQKFMG